MSAAARVKPESFFTDVQWATLSSKSSWRGLLLVLHCWVVIGLAMAVGVAWPWLIPLLVMVIGNRQLGLFILMHDAAHGLLHPNRAVNDRVARWFCGSELIAYRPYHLQHHRFVQQSEDPDLVIRTVSDFARLTAAQSHPRPDRTNVFQATLWRAAKPAQSKGARGQCVAVGANRS